MRPNLQTLKLHQREQVLWVSIDNPPINLLTAQMLLDLDRLGRYLESQDMISVVVFHSEISCFFIAHADLNMFKPEPDVPLPNVNVHQVFGRFEILPQVCIGLVNGRAFGGGLEFLLSLDFCFASEQSAKFGFIEAALGTIPGAGGTQRLPRICGKARALELLMSCEEINSDLAMQYGLINRHFPEETFNEMTQQIIHRIGKFPSSSIRAIKKAVSSTAPSLDRGLAIEANEQTECITSLKSSHSRVSQFLVNEGQSPETQVRGLNDLLIKIQTESP